MEVYQWHVSVDFNMLLLFCYVTDQMFIFFPDEPKVGIKTIKQWVICKVNVHLKCTCTGFANFIAAWCQCHFCVTNSGVILEYLESSIITKKAIFWLSGTWSSMYTLSWAIHEVAGPLTWKAQIHDGGHWVNFDRNLPFSCFNFDDLIKVYNVYN